MADTCTLELYYPQNSYASDWTMETVDAQPREVGWWWGVELRDTRTRPGGDAPQAGGVSSQLLPSPGLGPTLPRRVASAEKQR